MCNTGARVANDVHGAGAAVSIGEVGQEYTVYPTIELGIGESHTRSDGIVIRRYTTHYSCSCPAWRFQRAAVQRRTCTHLADVLGNEFERVRMIQAAHEIETAPSLPRTPKKRRQHDVVSPGTPNSVSSSQSTRQKKHHGQEDPICIAFGDVTLQIGVESSYVRWCLQLRVLLARKWDSSCDPSGWWFSEKVRRV